MTSPDGGWEQWLDWVDELDRLCGVCRAQPWPHEQCHCDAVSMPHEHVPTERRAAGWPPPMPLLAHEQLALLEASPQTASDEVGAGVLVASPGWVHPRRAAATATARSASRTDA